jgi:hypothetical protein
MEKNKIGFVLLVMVAILANFVSAANPRLILSNYSIEPSSVLPGT